MKYPPPTYHYSLIKSWYRLLKAKCECATCKKHGVHIDDTIELHHIDRTTKTDTVSNMVYQLAPLSIIMNETLKCIPLCKSHHTDYHKHETNNIFTKENYNFIGDSKYLSAKEEFDANAWLLAPTVMKERYIQYAELKNEICARQDKRPFAPTIPNGEMLRARA